MIDYKDTISLIAVMEKIQPPASFLLDTFFPNVEPVQLSSKILIEYREGKRRLAPYILKNSSAMAVNREGTYMNVYQPPMIGARRIVTPDDIEQRAFGENIYSSLSPDQRAAQIQARDLVELQDMITNRKNQMAAEILTTGKCKINGFSDDGKLELVDMIDYAQWKGSIIPVKKWSEKTAKIYSDIKEAVDFIQQETGFIPNIMVCGRNVENYLLQNDELKNWLLIPNRDNLAMMTLQPQFISPSIRRLGLLSALNLEVYSYYETYINEAGVATPFIADDDVIIAVSGQGRQIHGAVTLVDNTSYQSFAAQFVPQYLASPFAQSISLSVYSRCILAPNFSNSWCCIHSGGQS